ncbi:hypothetical protein DPX16_7256 [Anabarilius grahami]|uniref:Uncharacterized protein n=1 Tax=Anabarilius grahami TaxID=495550 RepID=A0A3N0XMV3_ANAGA|nr:hypothetical protein DPX16_7256 [Anabarilius grahami]
MVELAEEMTTVEQKTTAEPEAPMEEPAVEESMMEPADSHPKGLRTLHFLPEDEGRGVADPLGGMDRNHPDGGGEDGGEGWRQHLRTQTCVSDLFYSKLVSIYQKWSKEGTVVNRRQGHGRPRLTDARGERRLARGV